jgi:hypothetical protein
LLFFFSACGRGRMIVGDTCTFDVARTLIRHYLTIKVNAHQSQETNCRLPFAAV